MLVVVDGVIVELGIGAVTSLDVVVVPEVVVLVFPESDTALTLDEASLGRTTA